MIMRMPSRTAITLSEPDGRKLTISPIITVTTPRKSVACQVLAAINPAGVSWSSVDMGGLLDPFPGHRVDQARRGDAGEGRVAFRAVTAAGGSLPALPSRHDPLPRRGRVPHPQRVTRGPWVRAGRERRQRMASRWQPHGGMATN